MGLDILLYRAEHLDGRDPKALEKLEYSGMNSEFHIFHLDDETPEFMEMFKDFIFDSEEDVYDIEGLLAEKGYTWDDIETHDQDYPYRDDTFYPGCYRFVMKDGKTITIDNARTIQIPFKGILCKEVGYQRKGANRNFYADNMWGPPAVFTNRMIHEHWDKYFSGEGNIEKEGGIQVTSEGKVTVEDGVPFGFGVEYDNTPEENRQRFKESIIDKFIEGETFVVYC
jgi:hypothetical protein